MAAPSKYNEVMSVIKRRIREGDYLVRNIPGERRLAEETGVSYMTARRAVGQLLDEKVLIRQPSGVLEVHPSYSDQINPAEVVLLYPAYPSSYLTQMRVIVSEAASKRGLSLRPVQYVHWDENIVMDVVEQAKGTLVIPYGPEIPDRLVGHFLENRVVILDGDFSPQKLPSIRLFSQQCIERVLDLCFELGHRRVDCLNSQNHNPEITRRIQIWRDWLEKRGCTGTLHDEPAEVFTDPTIVAYNMMSWLQDQGHIEATAFVGTTCPAAIGAIRACYERGIEVGKSLSIAAMNLEPPAEFYCPSITGLNTPDLSSVLRKCFDWFASDNAWRGAKLIEPTDSTLHVGESTCAPILEGTA